ncbi:MAG: hypothetical protein ABIV36_22880 [Sphingobium limneticum]
MEDDIEGALTRFELFLESKESNSVIDFESGLTTDDLQLLLGQLKLAQSQRFEARDRDELVEGPVGLL